MGRSLRSQFLKRISSVGWGARESVQMILSAVVTELREEIADGAFAEADLERVIAFHDDVEALWRDALATDPPIPVDTLRRRLDVLLGMCYGPLDHKRILLERARKHQQTLEVTKQVRGRRPSDEEQSTT